MAASSAGCVRALAERNAAFTLLHSFVNGIEAGRIGRQIPNAGTSLFDQLGGLGMLYAPKGCRE